MNKSRDVVIKPTKLKKKKILTVRTSMERQQDVSELKIKKNLQSSNEYQRKMTAGSQLRQDLREHPESVYLRQSLQQQKDSS